MSRIRERAVVPMELAGQRLDQAAAELFPVYSRSRLSEWIKAGALTVARRFTPASLLSRIRCVEKR